MTTEEATVTAAAKRILNRFNRKKGNLIPILQKVQGKLGYLPRESMLEIARFLGIPEIDVYSVVTFYNQFRINPPGEHSIKVCLGTACHMKGGYINKCVLCRRCIWVCREHLSIGVLGFAHRGFQRAVTTFADEPIGELGCQDCRECVIVCPTGALVFKDVKEAETKAKAGGSSVEMQPMQP